MSYNNLPTGFYTQLEKISNDLRKAIQETTGKIPIGLLVTIPQQFPQQFSNTVGILTEEGFDGLTFTQSTKNFALSIRPQCFEEGEIFLDPYKEGEICLESLVEFYCREDNNQKFHYRNHGNILLPHQHVNELLTQMEGLVLLQGYVSYGFLVADAGPDEEVRRLWCLIHSIETEYYNTTGHSDCIYLDVNQHPVSLIPVNMIGEPEPIPLVLKGEWEVAVVHAERDDLDFMEVHVERDVLGFIA